MHTAKFQKPIRKGYIQYNHNCMTFWKRQYCGDSEKNSG